jgi:hypothetical protein
MTPTPLTIRDLARIVVADMQCGKSRDEIVGFLMTRGWPEVSARRFVLNTLSDYSLADPGSRTRPRQPGEHRTLSDLLHQLFRRRGP